MKKTGYLYDDRFQLHATGPMHPECSDRLKAIHSGIEKAGLLEHLVRVTPRPASQSRIEAVHHVNYILRFEEACLLGMNELDYPDNQMCRESYDIALLAAGGVMEAAKMVAEKEIDNAFCSVRPPGHHAEIDRAMGFCYFNNVAVAARYLQDELGFKRVAIVDIDVHHGNGTQHIFDRDPSVLYYSVHEHPTFLFPGTGRDFDKGIDAGYGYTVNSPLLPGQGDEEYREAVEQDLYPALEMFKPEFIILSTGFDAHEDDDMSDINLTTEGYSWLMKTVVSLAGTYADGKIVSVLEGGYNLERLPELAKNHVEILMED